MSAAVDTTQDVDVDLTKEVPCEHPEHGQDSYYHEGPGELVIQCLLCPKCGNRPRGVFICCRAAYVRGGHRQNMYCTVCGHWGYRDEFWLLLREL